MQYEKFRQFQIPDVHQSYGARDAITYALSVGAGAWIEGGKSKQVVLDTMGPTVLPSYCVDLCHPGFWLADPRTTVDATRNLHAEEYFEVFGPLPACGKVTGRTRIVDVVDKGAEKGALVYLEKEVRDDSNGQLLARTRRTLLLRGDGGYEGPSGTPRPAPDFPQGSPDLVRLITTRPDQAFLYRLNGDVNPLHVEESIAKKAGFDRPIMHGLCTFGIAATTAFFELAGGDATRFRSFGARFTAPMYPGETLRIEMWRCGALRAFAHERDVLVLSFGKAEILPLAGT